MKIWEKNVKLHEELRLLSKATYQNSMQDIPEGYTPIKNSSMHSDTGFFARALEKDGRVIIAICGTEDFRDFYNDIQMGINRLPLQIEEAKEFIKSITTNPKYNNSDIILTGHSLGGSLAQILGSTLGLKAVTFNAYGTKNILEHNKINYNDSNVINYCNKLDGITTMNSENHIGEVYEIKSKSKGGAFHDHYLGNQYPITEQTPITPEELKRKEGVEAVQNKAKTGIQTVSKMQHDMDVNNRDIFNQLFKNFLNLYESPTENSKFNNKTFGGYRLNNGSGEIYVKEYTRKDGTVVRAHWRSYSGEFDPNKRLSEMNEPELSKAISFWMDEDKFI